MNVATAEEGPGAEEQEDACGETQHDRCRGSFLERRLQEPEERGDRHRTDADSEQNRAQSLGTRTHEEDRDGAEPGRECGRAGSQRQDQDVHARILDAAALRGIGGPPNRLAANPQPLSETGLIPRSARGGTMSGTCRARF